MFLIHIFHSFNSISRFHWQDFLLQLLADKYCDDEVHKVFMCGKVVIYLSFTVLSGIEYCGWWILYLVHSGKVSYKRINGHGRVAKTLEEADRSMITQNGIFS